MMHGRSRTSNGTSHRCPRCGNPRLRWDPEYQEWYCTLGGCGATFPDGSTSPEDSLSGPVQRVRLEQPPVEASQPAAHHDRCTRIGSVPGLRCLRAARGLSQADLAELIGTTRDSVSDWENGRSSPSLEVLFRLLDRLNIPLEALRCNGRCGKFIIPLAESPPHVL